MATPGDKAGPLSADDLEAIWSAAVDKSYRDPLLKAGDGGGMEVYRQAFAQLARASLATDRSFQALFAQPFSGQTQSPASGSQQATVTLTFARTGYLDRAIVLGAGLVWVDEGAIDSGDSGGVEVDTGRRYLLQETIVFFPGEQGPFSAVAVAEKPGWGYNEPLPETLTIVEQVGSSFSNVLATVSVTAGTLPPASPSPSSRTILVAINEPDMFVPEHVGQYVSLSHGSNAGKIARMIAFTSPDASLDVGSSVDLEMLAAVATTTVAGVFEIGEAVQFSGATTGNGVVVAERSTPDGQGRQRLAVVITSGSVALGTIFTGVVSGATATTDTVYVDGSFTAEAPSGGVGGASWNVLDWARDIGLTSTNAASPEGGVLGMLDLLGAEKLLPRSPGETDADYRERVTTIADVVSPNAIRRALNRSLGSLGWCFREVGTALMPGFFYDRAGDESGDFYDWGSLLFDGTYSGAQFIFQEECEYRRGIDVLARGYWGSWMQPVAHANPAGSVPSTVTIPLLQPAPGADFTLVLTRDRFRLPFPTITPQAGDVIVGLVSGETFSPAIAIADSHPQVDRWRCWLDYDEMRAFFAVEIPQFGFGEFGFAYDVGPHDAYDAAPYNAFYDGFPIGAAALYSRVWAAVEGVRAGGAEWILAIGDGTCS